MYRRHSSERENVGQGHYEVRHVGSLGAQPLADSTGSLDCEWYLGLTHLAAQNLLYWRTYLPRICG